MRGSISIKAVVSAIFLALIVVSIPIAIYLVKQQQDVRNRASSPSGTATISVSPATATLQTGTPQTVTVSFNTNGSAISGIAARLSMKADGVVVGNPTVSSSLTGSGDWACPFHQSAVEGDIVNIDVSCLNTSPEGFSSTSDTELATFTITANAVPTTNPITMSFDPAKSIFTQKSDNQDVLLTPSSQGSYTVAGAGTGGVGESPTPSPSPSPQAGASPTPLALGASPTPSITPSNTGGSTTNITKYTPVCSSVSLDRGATGTAPFAVAFTANGSDQDGTVTKVHFDFGNGQSQDITNSGGVGTNKVAAVVSYNFTTAGTYKVVATLTDNDNLTSSCAQTITVTGTSSNAPIGGGQSGPTTAPTLSQLPVTGMDAPFTVLAVGGGMLLILGVATLFIF